MSDYFEIDFLDVENKKSGDAITVRYSVDNVTKIHVVDGGFQETGSKVVEHIQKYYNNPQTINHVVVTHQDRDHAGGLVTILESFNISELWMLRPWNYTSELLPRFARFTSEENLCKRLKEIYPSIATLESIAVKKGIKISDPFQGARIGSFVVMAPTKDRYLDLIVESDKTPPPSSDNRLNASTAFNRLCEKTMSSLSFVRALWGEENFSSEETSAENATSIVQYANIAGKKILLTGDTDREGLEVAANFAPTIGLSLPGIDRFQVPHHGSRRNLSTELLNRWLGAHLKEKPEPGAEIFTALISASKEDDDHPRKAVVRAMIHRGGKIASTKDGRSFRTSFNAPERKGWVPIKPTPYPEDQEE